MEKKKKKNDKREVNLPICIILELSRSSLNENKFRFVWPSQNLYISFNISVTLTFNVLPNS